MNKRQWKKKYKKEHGHNPPNERQVKNFAFTYSCAASQLFDNMRNVINRALLYLKNAIEDIRTMPENEFEERIKNLTQEQQALIRKIRTKS